MRPIVNMSEKDRGTYTGSMRKNLVKMARVVSEIYALSMGKKTPSRQYALRLIVNALQVDRATETGNMQKNLVKIARVVPEISWGTDRQTDPQTDILITILRNRSRGQSNKRFLRAEFNDTDTLNKQTKSRNDTRCVNRWPGKKSCHSCRKLLVLK